MKLTAAIKKANKTGIVITETDNGHFYFENHRTNKKGSAWLKDGVFDLPRKIFNEEHASNMNDLFRYLNR